MQPRIDIRVVSARGAMTEPYELGKAPNIGPKWALIRSMLDEVGGVRMKEGGFSCAYKEVATQGKSE